jgi:excisionase family DNA binding protein
MHQLEPIYLPDLHIPRPVRPDQLPPLLVSRKQAARLLNVSEDTIQAMMNRGELSVWRRGKLVRIRYSSLVEAVENEQAS